MQCEYCGEDITEEVYLHCTDCGAYFCNEDCGDKVPCPNHYKGLHCNH